MEQLTTLTGLTKDQLRDNLREIIAECVINSADLEITKRHVIVLNAICDLV